MADHRDDHGGRVAPGGQQRWGDQRMGVCAATTSTSVRIGTMSGRGAGQNIGGTGDDRQPVGHVGPLDDASM